MTHQTNGSLAEIYWFRVYGLGVRTHQICGYLAEIYGCFSET